MTVAELIAELQKCDPHATVTIWDAYDDVLSKDVLVKPDRYEGGTVHLDYGDQL